MRKEFLDGLEEQYKSTPPTVVDFANSIEADVKSPHELSNAIFRDLDTKKLGIGWWAPHVKTSQRIVTGDYLYRVAGAITTNIAEARLHFHHLQHCFDEENNFSKYLPIINGRPKLPKRVKGKDEYWIFMTELHLAGFFRALGSVLDCLGASIVGVLALPTDIIKADFGKARRCFAKIRKQPTSEGQLVQTDFEEHLNEIVVFVGPPGWNGWVDKIRNTFVHRARRFQLTRMDHVDTRILNNNGGQTVRSIKNLQLPNVPDFTDIEAWSGDGENNLLLGENATTTINGCYKSVESMATRISKELIEIWAKRRAAPTLLVQPESQWDKASRNGVPFSGYKTDAPPFSAESITASPNFIKRLRAASLDGERIHHWKNFDQ